MAYTIHIASLLAQDSAGTDVVTSDNPEAGVSSAPAGAGEPVSLDEGGNPTEPLPQCPPQGQQGSPWQSLLPLGLMLIVIYFFMFRGPQKRQKEHKEMVANLKRGQKIRTIGGIIGKVVEVNNDEIVIKVDESTNTKMTIVRNAIGTVITDDQKDSKS